MGTARRGGLGIVRLTFQSRDATLAMKRVGVYSLARVQKKAYPSWAVGNHDDTVRLFTLCVCRLNPAVLDSNRNPCGQEYGAWFFEFLAQVANRRVLKGLQAF